LLGFQAAQGSSPDTLTEAENAGLAGFCSLRHHINGAFAADIRKVATLSGYPGLSAAAIALVYLKAHEGVVRRTFWFK
jgi:hypothetical protein